MDVFFLPILPVTSQPPDLSFRIPPPFQAGEESAVHSGDPSFFPLILPITSQLTRPVIPSEMARFLLSRSLVRTSRVTQARNPSSIDRGAKSAWYPAHIMWTTTA
jgi:hypothetical protein